ncbi:hypothetical protein KUCAC02_003635 [Chaenocephalus aceratus]|uniref:Uncharacterized protein n=1 Tax=Chaenocephalus aceratus TaxID=36190 RepID=A0ACB9WM66_CHAAC|nr:hypothetical protein KUCAC02_003635 [Chaenocephalus aceratus]
MRIVNLLQDYLQELEDKGEENPKESQEEDLNTCSDIKPPTVKIFCQWVLARPTSLWGGREEQLQSGLYCLIMSVHLSM